MNEQQTPYALDNSIPLTERAGTLIEEARYELSLVEKALTPLCAEPGENQQPDLPSAKRAVQQLIGVAREMEAFVTWLESEAR